MIFTRSQLLCKNFFRQTFLRQLLSTQSGPPKSGKPFFSRGKKHCNVGTIGHVNHGKTTLTSAITKFLSENKLAQFKPMSEIDSTSEEQKRGLSINSTRIEYETDERHYCHTDCPGHVDYIKNMITGSAMLDGAILVVSASEGALAQTKEHLYIVKNMGVDRVIVYINKMDEADSEKAELVELEVREMLTDLGLEGEKAPFILGSALHALENKSEDSLGLKSVVNLLKTIDTYIPCRPQVLDKPFLFPIMNTFFIQGVGAIVSGRVDCGVVKKGMPAEILGYNFQQKTSITSTETFNKILEEGLPGDQLDCLLHNVKRDDIRRGMVVSVPGNISLHNHLEVEIKFADKKILSSEFKPFTSGAEFQLFSMTWDVTSKVVLKNKDTVSPGEKCILVLQLKKNMAVKEGQSLILRDGGLTLGAGTVRKILADITPEQFAEMEKAAKKAAKEKRVARK